jgi:hypothetical protein
MKIAESGARAGSVSQRYRSADTVPYQNVTDPQHCPQQKEKKENSRFEKLAVLPERIELYPKAFKSLMES